MIYVDEFPPGPFSLVYADPPWKFRDKAHAGARGAEHKYPVMGQAEICDMPVRLLVADTALLALWWVASQPEEAIAVAEAWGFRVRHMTGVVWVKETVNGSPAFGMGHYTRAGAECLLLATRGRWTDLRQSRSVRQVITAPLGRHSEKPEAVADALEVLVGDVPRIELFARRFRPGWSTWGNELPERC